MEYKQVRLHQDYIIKLRKMADLEKRSMSKMLEVLIDGEQPIQVQVNPKSHTYTKNQPPHTHYLKDKND